MSTGRASTRIITAIGMGEMLTPTATMPRGSRTPVQATATGTVITHMAAMRMNTATSMHKVGRAATTTIMAMRTSITTMHITITTILMIITPMIMRIISTAQTVVAGAAARAL
ncbi:MAG: hypothetical protein Q4A98_11035 [Comamonadaceae bacterium]|nr:hypothetical protein [Comamonadaceae bacterium]